MSEQNTAPEGHWHRQSPAQSIQHRAAWAAGEPNLPEELAGQDSAVEFVGGNPTPEEIAAVTAVVVAAATETEAASSTGARRAQNRRARLGLRLKPGLGAWRRTLPFR